MRGEVDPGGFHRGVAPPLDPLRGPRRQRLGGGEDERPERSSGPRQRCTVSERDRETGERTICGARAAWRLDVICDVCGPRVGHCCTAHHPAIELGIAQRRIHCTLEREDAGYIVELVHAEWLWR